MQPIISIKANPLPKYRELYQLPKGTWLVINIGGRGGAKSYETSKFVLLKAISENKRCVILRDEKTTIGESILNEIKNRFEEIDEKTDGFLSTQFSMQENSLKTKDKSNSLIFTKGFRTSSNKKQASLKSISDVDIALIEEFEDITDEEKFNKLADSIRNKDSIIVINSNTPDKNHWFVKRYFDLVSSDYDGYYHLKPKKIEGVVYIITDYSDNPFLQQKTIDKYKAYGDISSPFYDLHYYCTQILGLCSTGKKGQIYTKFQTISHAEFNNLPYKSVYGLDFGWGASPMALIEAKFHNNKMYAREILYKYNMTELELHIELHRLGITIEDVIIADSAEPNTISKLRAGYNESELTKEIFEKTPQLTKGFFVYAALKGPGSKGAMIKKVKDLEVYVTESSSNIWNEELPNYIWAVDKNGNSTDKPVENFDHLLDCMGYLALSRGRHF